MLAHKGVHMDFSDFDMNIISANRKNEKDN